MTKRLMLRWTPSLKPGQREKGKPPNSSFAGDAVGGLSTEGVASLSTSPLGVRSAKLRIRDGPCPFCPSASTFMSAVAVERALDSLLLLAESESWTVRMAPGI